MICSSIWYFTYSLLLYLLCLRVWCAFERERMHIFNFIFALLLLYIWEIVRAHIYTIYSFRKFCIWIEWGKESMLSFSEIATTQTKRRNKMKKTSGGKMILIFSVLKWKQTKKKTTKNNIKSMIPKQKSFNAKKKKICSVCCYRKS